MRHSGPDAANDRASQHLPDRNVGFDIALVDLGFTVAALVSLVNGWRRLDAAPAVRLGALLVFLSLGNLPRETRVLLWVGYISFVVNGRSRHRPGPPAGSTVAQPSPP